MDWETPAWTEIAMDAELASYVDDLVTAEEARGPRGDDRRD
jgi:hypothetical protein